MDCGCEYVWSWCGLFEYDNCYNMGSGGEPADQLKLGGRFLEGRIVCERLADVV